MGRNVKSGPNCKMIVVIIAILSIVFIQQFLDQDKTMDLSCWYRWNFHRICKRHSWMNYKWWLLCVISAHSGVEFSMDTCDSTGRVAKQQSQWRGTRPKMLPMVWNSCWNKAMAVERERELPGSALVADIYQKKKHRGNFERIKCSKTWFGVTNQDWLFPECKEPLKGRLFFFFCLM